MSVKPAPAAPGLLLLTTSYPSRGDGSEAAGSFVADFARALAAHRPVRVVAPGEGDDSADGVQVHRFAAPAVPLSTLRPWRPRELLAIREVLRAGMAATRRAAGDGGIGHCLALWALPCGAWARRLQRERGIPYSTWALGSDIWSLGRLPLVRGRLRRVLREAAHCYADGLQLAQDAERIAGRKVAFLPSTRRIGRRRDTPTRAAPPYRLAFLGRWHPNKGVDLLLDALGRLDDEDWARIERVDLAGGGPLETQVRAGVEALTARGRPVRLQGFLDKSAAEALFCEADYVLIPSRIESIPVVFSDAMKLGCPVLAMPVGDLPRLIAGPPSCGAVATGVDAGAYAELLSAALKASPVGHAAGVATRAAEFDLDAIATRLHRELPP